VKQILTAAFAIGILVMFGGAAGAQVISGPPHCYSGIAGGATTAVQCVAGTGTTKVIYVYQFDNTANSATTYFQLYPGPTIAPVPFVTVAVPPGAAEVIPIAGGDAYSVGTCGSASCFLVMCSTTVSGSPVAPAGGCNFAIWYQ
jgi:hypothetical protein